ncbi:Sigma-70, region 4 [Pseudobacteriovorax antillogorgiicola]|uniref:Sigma-70, region 4 n=2 Tax=Pseudobacteriovorax antillogorgiicola TaxID=1513793 RepID=A0A1Y6B5X5_9BACT|nr:sigma-70-like protein [Pseudobacteriovorax antillogorgiicola]SME93887.1 Sigma-70, region 4 [Pseudobacteriovorax antillogorgiicola]
MQAETSPTKDPGQVAFFVGNLCQEADLIYRFGYALTLSEVGAAKLVMETYRSLIGQLDRLLASSSQDIRLELAKAAWHIFQSWNETFEETDSLVLDFLHSLTIDIRIVLTLVDALGFSPEETAQILELKDVELRRYLAEGRKQMIGFDS